MWSSPISSTKRFITSIGECLFHAHYLRKSNVAERKLNAIRTQSERNPNGLHVLMLHFLCFFEASTKFISRTTSVESLMFITWTTAYWMLQCIQIYWYLKHVLRWQCILCFFCRCDVGNPELTDKSDKSITLICGVPARNMWKKVALRRGCSSL